MHITPNNRNAIHPGDRILEINGTPVRTLRVEEVNCIPSLSSGGETWNSSIGNLGYDSYLCPHSAYFFILPLSPWPMVTSYTQSGMFLGQQGWLDRWLDSRAERIPVRGHSWRWSHLCLIQPWLYCILINWTDCGWLRMVEPMWPNITLLLTTGRRSN